MPRLHSERWKRSGPLLRHAITAAFFVGLIALLSQRVRTIDWIQVGHSLSQLPATDLVIAVLIAAVSYALYASFDLIGRHYMQHRLSRGRVFTTALISYAFNLNLGALIGGVGFRYRLYSRAGLQQGTITRVLCLSMLSNWLGYGPLLAAVLLAGAVVLPEAWTSAAWFEGLLILLAVLALLPAAFYVGTCAFTRHRVRQVRGLSIRVPSASMALLQLGLSMLNWSMMAAIVWTLLGQQIGYERVLGALLLAAVAGVITHVPAGLGVLEAVFVALLGRDIDPAPLLASLLAYRAIYYLAPGAIALLLYLVMEGRGRKRNSTV